MDGENWVDKYNHVHINNVCLIYVSYCPVAYCLRPSLYSLFFKIVVNKYSCRTSVLPAAFFEILHYLENFTRYNSENLELQNYSFIEKIKVSLNLWGMSNNIPVNSIVLKSKCFTSKIQGGVKLKMSLCYYNNYDYFDHI